MVFLSIRGTLAILSLCMLCFAISDVFVAGIAHVLENKSKIKTILKIRQNYP